MEVIASLLLLPFKLRDGLLDMASSIRPTSRLSSKQTFTIVAVILVAVVGCDARTSKQPASSQSATEGNYNYYYNNNNNNNNNNQESFGAGEYLSDWSDQEWVKLSGRIQQPKCIDIPSNLTLCHGIGYEKMMLPNLLEHDSLNEVTQQAASWVPLTRINCHPDVKVFLCSLFSPVCLDRLIYPCRSLCDGVRASCVGRMKTYGFDWPDMLKCDKFPLDNDMCIKLIHNVKPDNNCTACKHPLTHESLIDQFCRSSVVMRASIKEFKDVNGHKELVLRKKRTLFKHQGLNKSQIRKLTPVIEGGASCSCENINSTQDRYLLMGSKKGEQLIISFGMAWNRKDKEFRKGINAIRKGNTCEGIFKEISANGIDNKPPSSGKVEKTKKTGNKKTKVEQTNTTEATKEKKGKKGKKGQKDKSVKKKKGKGKGKGKNNMDKTNQKSPNKAGKPGDAPKSKTAAEDKAISNFMKASN